MVRTSALFLLLSSLPSSVLVDGAFLVGNTRGNFDITMIADDGSGSIFIDGAAQGLEAPDHIVSHQGYYYISTGTEVNTSSIARMDRASGEFQLIFATGGGLKRPYGFAFDGNILYVASFMTDQVLMYDAMSGEYMGVFAQGNATEEGLVNGPNQIAIFDGTLYMTTQGSYIDENGGLQYAFASQIVAFDLATGEGSVFVPQPDPDPNGVGFISMLGIMIGCDQKSVLSDDCSLYTTDFAGGLRTYALRTGELVDFQTTSYASGAFSGSIAMDDDGIIYVTGFTGDANGVIMAFDPDDDPTNNSTLALLYGPNGELSRPIGILYIEEEDDGGPMMTPLPSVEPSAAPNEVGSSTNLPTSSPDVPAEDAASILGSKSVFTIATICILYAWWMA